MDRQDSGTLFSLTHTLSLSLQTGHRLWDHPDNVAPRPRRLPSPGMSPLRPLSAITSSTLAYMGGQPTSLASLTALPGSSRQDLLGDGRKAERRLERWEDGDGPVGPCPLAPTLCSSGAYVAGVDLPSRPLARLHLQSSPDDASQRRYGDRSTVQCFFNVPTPCPSCRISPQIWPSFSDIWNHHAIGFFFSFPPHHGHPRR